MYPNIPFINLSAQQDLIRLKIDHAIQRVLEQGMYILGPEVFELEKQLAEFCGVKHAITCANGTDALGLSLRAKGVSSGDAIFVPSFTFTATAEVIVWLGATPVFIDSLYDSYNMDPNNLELGIKLAIKARLKPTGIIVVDLFGQPADYDAIQQIATKYNLWLIADGAQSFGASYKGHKVGAIGDLATTSFFPAKPLGCYGDGGAVFTNDDQLAELIKSLRVHGQGVDKYDNIHIGVNSRLDTIQAAILKEKLKIFPKELIARQNTAEAYSNELKDLVIVPKIISGSTSSWAQYTIKLPKEVNREQLIAHLKKVGIPTMIYYPKPLHTQKIYQKFSIINHQNLSICEVLAKEVLSLPMCGYVEPEIRSYITTNIRNFCKHSSSCLETT